MDEERQCSVCGAGVLGPMAPRITLSYTAPGEEVIKVEAWAWVCSDCGLVHWYSEEGSLARLQDAAGEHQAVPGASYERRTQVQRMLRRVRRL